MHARGDHRSGKRLHMTPPRIKSHFLSRANHFPLRAADVKTAGQPLISAVEKKKKTCSNPLTPIAHSTPAISPAPVKSIQPRDSAFSAATPTVRHICSDSRDGCETETPALGYTREYDKL